MSEPEFMNRFSAEHPEVKAEDKRRLSVTTGQADAVPKNLIR